MGKLKNWYRKKFKKSEIVRVYIFDETGNINEFIVYPDKESNTINVNDCSYTFKVNEVFFKDGIATLLYKKDMPKPISVKDNGKIPEITSQEFNTAINNNVVKDLIKSTDNDKKDDILLGLVIMCVIGVGLIGWLTNTLMEMVALNEELILENQDLIDELLMRIR